MNATEINRYVSYGYHAVLMQMMVTAPTPPKEKDSGPKTIRFTLNFHTIKQKT